MSMLHQGTCLLLHANKVLRESSGSKGPATTNGESGEERWIKYRLYCGQELVIGGYFPGPHGFDSLIVGYYYGDRLMYVARTRNGFVPASRRQAFSKLKHLVTPTCPFANLPESRRPRFGEEPNAEKMKKAVMVEARSRRSDRVDRLRQSKSAGLRNDKNPRDVVKEQLGAEE